MFYGELFFITLFISTFFAMGGVGGAPALVPIFAFLGVPFNSAKAIGLFLNTSTTGISTIMNLKRKAVDIKFALPLAFSMMITAPIGAYLSQFVPEKIVKGLFLLFLLFAGSMLIFGKKEAKFNYSKGWLLIPLGGGVGIISGLLGVGGGSLLMPILILLGFDAKKMAIVMSFVVPFSTLTGFLTYLQIVELDWQLVAITTVGAVLGGYIGNYLMFFHFTPKQVKRLIGILLYIIAGRLLLHLL